MYKYEVNSSFRWHSSASPEAEVAAITLPPAEPDSDIQQLEEQHNSSEINASHIASKTPSEQQLEYILSNLLKYGVLIASSVVLLGGILYLIHHGSEPATYQIFHGEPSEFRSPNGVINAVLSGSRRGIIQLGLLLLIATPILRVIISLLAFTIKRELTYIVVTMLVLASLTYSLVGAYF
ncbi:hypothetical protein ACX27_25415 [Nostoc piscinale CENA21]|uniref:DUF1634 domain-containing protein n=1 Tax=Nostoc piscinale CENA21 TaxID=224013 RepID=A0A0M3V6C2_9NOSO|nr:DUF1634 domain-containing protein [Nostoc piscinale]ALF55403.1 hypothetical protein ACX27_25415 [Nostoc piscinale CENA21]